MNRDLYIYYRVRSEQAGLLQTKTEAMQRSLSAEYGIVTGLKRRPEAKEGRHTWMEVYLNVPEGFDATIETAVAQAGLAEVIDGPRHTEYFLDFSTCA
jgi:hypothetical protein